MESKKICYFHKFNFCKKKDCKYFHPSEVCDEKCNIRTCLKRHLQTSQCMFHTMFQKCRNKDSCKFLHETPQPVEDFSKEEIETLRRKIHELEEDNRNIKSEHAKVTDHLKERIINLEASVKDLISNMATLIISKEIQNEDEIMEDQNEDDESSFMTNESSYYAREDLELKEILKEELLVTNNIKTNINDISENLKPRIIDETISKLEILKYNVQNDLTRIKSIERHPDSKQYSEEFYEMTEKFMKLTEILKNVAKNKFRKVAEVELKKLDKEINWVKQDKQGTIIGMFDV